MQNDMAACSTARLLACSPARLLVLTPIPIGRETAHQEVFSRAGSVRGRIQQLSGNAPVRQEEPVNEEEEEEE